MTAGASAPVEDELGGIGVELKVAGQNIVVNHIVPDTPAAAQKDLHVGDRILAVTQDRGTAPRFKTSCKWFVRFKVQRARRCG